MKPTAYMLAVIRGAIRRYAQALRLEFRRVVLDRWRPIVVPDDLTTIDVATLNALRRRRLPTFYQYRQVEAIISHRTLDDGTVVLRCRAGCDSEDGETMYDETGVKRIDGDVVVVGWIELLALWRRPSTGDMYYRDAERWFDSLPAHMLAGL